VYLGILALGGDRLGPIDHRLQSVNAFFLPTSTSFGETEKQNVSGLQHYYYYVLLCVVQYVPPIEASYTG
jgi:hypothetical protein